MRIFAVALLLKVANKKNMCHYENSLTFVTKYTGRTDLPIPFIILTEEFWRLLHPLILVDQTQLNILADCALCTFGTWFAANRSSLRWCARLLIIWKSSDGLAAGSNCCWKMCLFFLDGVWFAKYFKRVHSVMEIALTLEIFLHIPLNGPFLHPKLSIIYEIFIIIFYFNFK